MTQGDITRRASAIVGAAFFAVNFAIATSGARAANVVDLASGRADLQVYLLEGRIQGGETLILQSLISKLPANKAVAVMLNSPGGNLEEGMKLGKFFHRARIPTFALGYGGGCHSACSIAFLGGRDREGRPTRTKMSGGALGFHQFKSLRSAADMAKKFTKGDIEQEVIKTRAAALRIIQYLVDIGEEMSILHLMLKAPAAELTFLTDEEAVTYGIHVMDERSERVIDSTAIKARIDVR